MRIAYGTCVGSWEKFDRNVRPWVSAGKRDTWALAGQPSIGAGYNVILDGCKARGFDAVILLHDDLMLLDPRAEEKFVEALAPDVALVGVCGGKSDRSLHWWNGEKVGRQMTDSGLLDFGPRAGDVSFIEGSIMVFSPWAVENLRFDERYSGFSSGYDDICIHALEAGKRNVVVDVLTHHHSTVGWKSPEREAEFERSEQMFRAKWGIR